MAKTQIDREKVINGLRILWTWCVVNPDYGNGLSIDECKYAAEWAEGALALLNAQEPVLDDTGVYHCVDCGHPVGYKNCEGVLFPHCFYCPKCGRAVKWK